jgi:hypothetical protein
MEQKLWNMMDRFFELLLLISGEKDKEEVTINHIL